MSAARLMAVDDYGMKSGRTGMESRLESCQSIVLQHME